MHQLSAHQPGLSCHRITQNQSGDKQALSGRLCSTRIKHTPNVPHVCHVEGQLPAANAHVVHRHRLADLAVLKTRPLQKAAGRAPIAKFV